jgi:phage shock protein A
MTAKEALAEVGKVNEHLQELRQKLHQARTGPISEVIPRLQQEIAEATARKEWLLARIQRMEKAGS